MNTRCRITRPISYHKILRIIRANPSHSWIFPTQSTSAGIPACTTPNWASGCSWPRFSAYILLRVGADPGTWSQGLLNIPIGTFDTAVLITSSATVVLSWAALKTNNFKAYRKYQAITLICAFGPVDASPMKRASRRGGQITTRARSSLSSRPARFLHSSALIPTPTCTTKPGKMRTAEGRRTQHAR
jgi:hypothetical protein